MPIQIFDTYATEYDNWFEHHTFEFQAELDQIRQVIRDIPDFSLEVGVGSGRFASSRTIPYGIDPSRPLLRMARKRGIEVVQGRGEYLPFKPDSFRYTEMITVICFLDNPLLTCAEIHRILVHDGILCIAFIEREGEIYKRYRDRQGKSRFLSHAKFYTREEVVCILSQSGFFLVSSGCIKGFCVLTFQNVK